MESKSSSNTMMAVVVCLGIWFAWQYYLEKKYPQAEKTQVAAQGADETSVNNKAAPAPSLPEDTTAVEATEILKKINSDKSGVETLEVLEGNGLKITFSSKGASIKDAELTNKASIVSKDDMGLLFTSLSADKDIDFSTTNFSLEKKSDTQLVMTGSKDGYIIKKTINFIPNKYLLQASVDVLGDKTKVKSISFLGGNKIPPEEGGGSFLSFSPPIHYQEYLFNSKNKTERDVVNNKEGVSKEHEQVQMAALGARYFTSIFLNQSAVLPKAIAERVADQSLLKITYPVLDKESINVKFDLYLGPKILSILKTVNPLAANVVDYGFFSIIAFPLLGIMKWFYSMIGNYGIAIILLTLLVRILTFPFTYVSYKSMKSMQKIQPELNRLKEKHKGDNQTLNAETMKLMRENKVNPAGGCLPMLLQLPIFWALYQVLQNSIELYKSPFFGWIHDLSQKDPYYILPVLMGLSMFAQQKMMPSTMDPAQQKVMMFMPIFFSFLMFGLPSGLTLYIFVSTLFGIVQQMLISRDAKPQTT